MLQSRKNKSFIIKFPHFKGNLIINNLFQCFEAQTTDAQRGNSLHSTAKNSIPSCLHWVSLVRALKHSGQNFASRLINVSVLFFTHPLSNFRLPDVKSCNPTCSTIFTFSKISKFPTNQSKVGTGSPSLTLFSNNTVF